MKSWCSTSWKQSLNDFCTSLRLSEFVVRVSNVCLVVFVLFLKHATSSKQIGHLQLFWFSGAKKKKCNFHLSWKRWPAFRFLLAVAMTTEASEQSSLGQLSVDSPTRTLWVTCDPHPRPTPRFEVTQCRPWVKKRNCALNRTQAVASVMWSSCMALAGPWNELIGQYHHGWFVKAPEPKDTICVMVGL